MKMQKRFKGTSKMLKFIFLPMLVLSHGLMWSPKPRQYDARIGTNIDSLRSPSNEYCRGLPIGVPNNIIVTNPFEIKLAISDNAAHIGDCSVEILDTSYNVLYTQQLPSCGLMSQDLLDNCIEPPGLVTGDMCSKSVFINLPMDLPHAFVVRWTWLAVHTEPNEFYELCADVVQRDKCPTRVRKA
jgi:hypothetical protein